MSRDVKWQQGAPGLQKSLEDMGTLLKQLKSVAELQRADTVVSLENAVSQLKLEHAQQEATASSLQAKKEKMDEEFKTYRASLEEE